MLKKIPVSQLRLGMYIHELCGSWMNHQFWKSSFLLKEPKDLGRLEQSSITEVWIDTAKGLDLELKGQTTQEADAEVTDLLTKIEATPQDKAPKRVSVVKEMQQAARICARSKEAVTTMFHEARMGKAVNTEGVANLVEEISSSISRNPGALISLARLKTADDYTYMHSVAVCALMVALARQLKLDETQTRDAGRAGLMHDLGKAMMPIEVLNKPGKLTDHEFAIMKKHPVDGHRLLVEGNCQFPLVLDVCLHHHEKVDGTGYPDGLQDQQISLPAKMGAVCDVYDAITSNRPYKAGWDPAESVRKMSEWCKGHFDERIFQAFVRSIGIYPIGSLVKMASNRLAVVIEQSGDSLLTPVVKVFLAVKSRSYITPEVLDLSKPEAKDKIVSREDPVKWGIKNLEQLWMS